MYLSTLQSDQSITWSDEDKEGAGDGVAQTAHCSYAPTAPTPGDPARLPYRALQALRQAGMQMRRRPRSRPQVLSVCQLPRLATANGLRSAGLSRSSGGASRQLSPGSRDVRGDL